MYLAQSLSFVYCIQKLASIFSATTIVYKHMIFVPNLIHMLIDPLLGQHLPHGKGVFNIHTHINVVTIFSSYHVVLTMYYCMQVSGNSSIEKILHLGTLKFEV